MSRSVSPWGSFRYEHGRLRLATPEELTPVDPQPWKPPHGWKALSEHAQAQKIGAAAKRQARLAVAGIGLVALAAIAALLAGCAHEVETAAPPQPIVLSERLGSTAAVVIGEIVGQPPKAVTYAGVTVIFSPSDAHDACLEAHEAVHAADQTRMGLVQWSIAYAVQLGECERENVVAWCLRSIALEAAAYRAQHDCQAKGAGR